MPISIFFTIGPKWCKNWLFPSGAGFEKNFPEWRRSIPEWCTCMSAPPNLPPLFISTQPTHLLVQWLTQLPNRSWLGGVRGTWAGGLSLSRDIGSAPSRAPLWLVFLPIFSQNFQIFTFLVNTRYLQTKFEPDPMMKHNQLYFQHSSAAPLP